ncbi:PAN domain-containing protein [Ditylenchus destructor]|uniref:PAN domain-containing protein n=1 Tax=Ditylenchus destructor TaxID=166010 RepID=A0AAD4R5S8_9BILA|nr:PAN domain-containing protein [Ditylenchus destructor]
MLSSVELTGSTRGYDVVLTVVVVISSTATGGLCKSVVYNWLSHSCRLYDHEGSKSPAILHPANGYDYYRRTATTQECGGPLQRFLSKESVLAWQNNIEKYPVKSIANELQRDTITDLRRSPKRSDPNNDYPRIPEPVFPEIIAKNGKKVIIPKIMLNSDLIKQRNLVSIRLSPAKLTLSQLDRMPETEQTHMNMKKQIVKAERKKILPMFASFQNDTYSVTNEGNIASENLIYSPKNRSKWEYLDKDIDNAKGKLPSQHPETSSKGVIYDTETETHLTQTFTSPILTKQEVRGRLCARNIGYYAVIGNEMILQNPNTRSLATTFYGIEQSNCVKHCSDNMGPRGDVVNCSSINYFPLNHKCEIYTTMAQPHGPAYLMESNNAIYIEKFCLPVHYGTQCEHDDVFILHAQKTIRSDVIKIAPSNSIGQCLKACLNNKECESSTFNSNVKKCILHRTNVRQNPDSIQKNDKGWVLIENACTDKNRRSNTSLQRLLLNGKMRK